MSLSPTTGSTQTKPCCSDMLTNQENQSVLITGDVLRLSQWFCYLICGLVDIFGTVTNGINIICFVKQGFKDPVNVSLLGLAISDLVSLVALMWTSLCFIPVFQESDVPFITMEVQYPTGAIPHIIFARITSCITALVTLERCLCITMPLKVKNIFTAKRVTIIIVSIFIIIIANSSPVFYALGLSWQFYPERNRTLLGITYSSQRKTLEQYFYVVNNFFVPFTASLIIIFGTIILVYKLHQQSIWRAEKASQVQQTSASDRDLRVAKMIVMISILFIVCFIPSGVAFLAMAIIPELNHGGRYINLVVLMHSICFVLESTNSSMNIFIYYSMSSRYRDTFNKLFSRVQEKIV